MEIDTSTHAFITGGASGIGLGIAEALAEQGAAVTLADIDGAAATGAAAALAAKGRRAFGLTLDVRDRSGWGIAKAKAEAVFGPVNILVNNAGIGPGGEQLADMPLDSWDRMIAINLTGGVNGVATFGAGLRAARRGHIVNVASMAGLTADHPGLSAYGAAKAGVVAMSEVLRAEMAPHGVGVSVVCPGLVSTNLGTTTEKVTGIVRGGDPTIMARGMAPAKVGAMVVEAIIADRLYVMTHPERGGPVKARFAAILAAFGL